MSTQFEIDCALIAGVAYRSTRDVTNRFPAPQGWTEIPQSFVTLPSGFEAVSFQRGNEIVISFAGTGPGFVLTQPDWWSNLALATGLFGSDQLREAAAYYLQVLDLNPGAVISFTGHSLGGGLASLLGVFFDRRAVTFDQAPFQASASTVRRDDLIGYLGGLGYTTDQLKALVPELFAFSALNVDARTGSVTGISVEGEILSSGFISFNRIGSQSPLPHGVVDVSSFDLHTQSLLRGQAAAGMRGSRKRLISDGGGKHVPTADGFEKVDAEPTLVVTLY